MNINNFHIVNYFTFIYIYIYYPSLVFLTHTLHILILIQTFKQCQSILDQNGNVANILVDSWGNGVIHVDIAAGPYY